MNSFDDEPTVEIIPSEQLQDYADREDMGLMICMRADEPTLSKQAVARGRCADCDIEIQFVADTPTRIRKVCRECGTKNYPAATRIAITEQTMQEALKLVGLPDTKKSRALINRIAVEGYKRSLGAAEKRSAWDEQ